MENKEVRPKSYIYYSNGNSIVTQLDDSRQFRFYKNLMPFDTFQEIVSNRKEPLYGTGLHVQSLPRRYNLLVPLVKRNDMGKHRKHRKQG